MCLAHRKCTKQGAAALPATVNIPLHMLSSYSVPSQSTWYIVGASTTGPFPSALSSLFWGLVLLLRGLSFPLLPSSSAWSASFLICYFIPVHWVRCICVLLSLHLCPHLLPPCFLPVLTGAILRAFLQQYQGHRQLPPRPLPAPRPGLPGTGTFPRKHNVSSGL